MDNSDKIEKFIVDELLFGGNKGQINLDDSLFASGAMDSLSLLRLIAFLEEQFGFIVHDNEVIPANFQSINDINSFVTNKIKEKQAQ